MTDTLKKGARVLGTERAKLAAFLKERYEAGESIRSLAVSTGRSYGLVHRILTEIGVALRGRSEPASKGTRQRNPRIEREVPGTADSDITVQIYLTDTSAGPPVEAALRELLLVSGVEDIRESPVVVGSWYRSLTGLLKRAADSDATSEARRAVEIQVLDRFQAGIDGATGDAVAKLITALDRTQGAVVQVGSVLLVKMDGTIIVRHLTSREMIHWQQNPGLFKNPGAALAELQRASQPEFVHETAPPDATADI
jgi:hypothetical protein